MSHLVDFGQIYTPKVQKCPFLTKFGSKHCQKYQDLKIQTYEVNVFV